MSLIDKLQSVHKRPSISMHVPGHKNNTIGELSNYIKVEHDLTEIPGLDDLHDPSEVLLDLNAFLSSKAPGYYAQAMVNGTTNGIISSLFYFKDKVKRFYIVEEAHKSVYHGLSLSDAEYSVITVDELLVTDVTNSCVIFTSPSYSGAILRRMDEYVEYIRTKRGYSLVDAAHGAHLSITNNFEGSLLESGADVVVESYHKMLPALTMASVLFVRDEHMLTNILFYINQVETSSPSYLVLASIEYAQTFYNDYDDTLFFKRRAILIEQLIKFGIEVIEQDDPAKILLNSKSNPYQLEKSFREQGIYSEMVTDEGVLWCLPLWHEGDRYPFDTLLENIAVLKAVQEEDAAVRDLSFLEGKLCTQNIVPYPPGVPLVLKGEVITAAALKTVQHYLFNHVKIEGIDYNINYYMKRADL